MEASTRLQGGRIQFVLECVPTAGRTNLFTAQSSFEKHRTCKPSANEAVAGFEKALGVYSSSSQQPYGNVFFGFRPSTVTPGLMHLATESHHCAKCDIGKLSECEAKGTVDAMVWDKLQMKSQPASVQTRASLRSSKTNIRNKRRGLARTMGRAYGGWPR